jgi:hypothetical protein
VPSRTRTNEPVCRCRGVVDELTVDRVGDPPLQTAHRFLVLLAGCSLASVVVATLGVEADLGERGDVDHVVESAVAGSGEPVTVLLAG